MTLQPPPANALPFEFLSVPCAIRATKPRAAVTVAHVYPELGVASLRVAMANAEGIKKGCDSAEAKGIFGAALVAAAGACEKT